MKEFLNYLPTIITTLVVIPLGAYVSTRFKNLATSDDLSKALSQLDKTTNLVETIKIQLNEKYWVKQQVWDTKRLAYEEILSCLYLTKSYIKREFDSLEEYMECFIHIGCVSFGPEEEEYQNEYAEYIEGEQKAYNEKHESPQAKLERKKLSSETRSSFANLESMFSIKSIYLDPDIKEIESLLRELKSKLYSEQPVQGKYDDLECYLESLLDYHSNNEEFANDIIVLAKNLAVRDLKLAE